MLLIVCRKGQRGKDRRQHSGHEKTKDLMEEWTQGHPGQPKTNKQAK